MKNKKRKGMESKENVCCVTDAYCLHRMRNENHTELRTLVTRPKRKCIDQAMEPGQERERGRDKVRKKQTGERQQPQY